MSFLALVLSLYFAAIVGPSGVAKISNPRLFALALRRQGIVPTWSAGGISVIFPVAEIIVALLLISGIAVVAAAVSVLGLFLLFLGVKAFLLVTKSSADCGCHGSEQAQRVDSSSVIAAAILASLAVVHLWLVAYATPVSWSWRLIGGCGLFCLFGCLFLVKVIARRRTQQPVFKAERAPLLTSMQE